MTNHYTDVCEKEIESLRQQLASCDAEVANLAALGSSYLNRANAAEQEVDSLCQQLANSQKREVMLRDALEYHQAQTRPIQRTEEALVATDDLDGLILCEKEPAFYLYKFNSLFGGGTFWSHRPTHNGETALESVSLYRAWEPK